MNRRRARWFLIVLAAQIGVPACRDVQTDPAQDLSITLTVTPTSGIVGATFSFTFLATGTSLSEVEIDFGDSESDVVGAFGANEAEATREHVYTDEGSYTVTARAIDVVQGEATAQVTVQVTAAP